MKHTFATMPKDKLRAAQQKGVKKARLKARWQRQLLREQMEICETENAETNKR